MLRITRDLVATLADAHRDDVVAACAVIRKCGARDDAAALVHAFLAAPDERTPLLSPVRAHGDAALARAL
ncbi:MAG TPA: hypothetical protein VK427_14315, partial [Kofleriaceae bacterium]|nr:hypothetical protein [Kofleriaceae bacterium]